MVRREEQPWQSRATLFLDNRAGSHRGRGVASSLEAAVSTAASIAVHLSRRGFMVRLVTATGEDPANAWHVRDTDLNTAPLLEALAVVDAVPQARLDTHWLTDPAHGGLLVAVAGSLDDVDLRLFNRMLHHSTTGMAVALDVDAWLGEGSRGAATGALASHGWRAVTLGPRDRLDTVWQDLGHTSAQAARAGGVISGVAR